MILGGFLMLPATFEKERLHDSEDHQGHDSDIRVTPAVLGIFAIALITAALSFTGLLCFAVRNALFQRDLIFLPCLASCVLGLLTVIYDFLVFSRYEFKTPALLTTVAAAVSTIVYSSLLISNQRRIGKTRTVPAQLPIPMVTHQHQDSESTLWQDPSYYQNYNRNMFPTAHVPREPPPSGYDPNTITEDEMQRQQMLMLLLNRDQPSTPDPSQSTFRLDWNGQDDEDAPRNGYYGPPDSAQPSTAYPGPSPGIVRQMTNELRPWDGVWRGVTNNRRIPRPTSREFREQRRREIERGGPE
ncbi:hypothetical protein CLAFUW4_03481 [Fulvia fulva]|uniref:Uncharacterized protein n=1 Tax=Passalora fulva TaxID=5499 RepID=A0A9Q8P5D7_PASFU|nr:uncharacterized protein CLAFUR5_03460 [Fulvia fulva]KAK4631132.1 hypothetical protein CLAFUR4_03470 [Fulvia fulva]KAK4632947.1 hypothetical protein CLAFUR0_03475 [Fulvia fulva]UJO13652.1 hypothetical protein CLAFUR5_03460 [Fulvia fulva]WPV11619.1 hypothetical protein CLAFUW4_03481 [Fulvia fulva]WPV25894.1 hypothetical protein CLAFUW7_03473 [Fulvia fulva]